MKKSNESQNASTAHRHAKTSAVINRLSRIEGHTKAVKSMIEEGKPCPDVLIQLAAIKSAIQKTAQVVLEDHIESCLAQAVTEGATDKEWHRLKEALEKYVG